MEFHSRCDDEGCVKRCRRPSCLEPGIHWFAKADRQGKRWIAFHQSYDCTVPRVPLPDVAVIAAARQAIEELNPNMTPSDVAVARRVIRRMLDRLEALDRIEVAVVDPPPLLLTAATEPKRPPSRPRELTRARAMHLEWMARKDGAA